MRRLLLALALTGCGGAPTRTAVVDPALVDEVPEPESGQPALQYYLVLTADAGAMPDKAAVDAMFAAVNGEGARYAAVRNRVKWVPGNYRLGVDLDFADLPHPAFSADKLAALLADLPPEVKAKAAQAKLAITLRSDVTTLPNADHIRLAGLAALYVADVSQGIIVDLLARRAWTPDAWQAELAAGQLGPDQVRLTQRADGDGTWLLTRGHPKFGAPDVQMRGIAAGQLAAARARFAEVQHQVQARGAQVGQRVAGVTLVACDAPKGMFDGACVQVPAP